MRLADALRLSPGKVLAFVGAGGKSSAIACLAREVSGEMPVVLTCTTRLGLEQSGLGRVHVALRARQALPDLKDFLRARVPVLVTGPLEAREGKWAAVGMDVLHALRAAAEAAGAVLLVEADGARGRSLKAPAEHEPVIPSFVDTVVPTAGLDVIGSRIDSRLVHRPERVAALLGKKRTARLGPEDLARILTDAEGGLKGAPPGSEVRLLLTKAEGETRTRSGVDAAELALRAGAVRAAVIASLKAEDPVRQVVGRTAGVVLAAGGSRRLESPKQLILWRGRPLVWHAVRAAIEGGLDPIAVVVGADAEAVAGAVAGEGVRVVLNPNWEAGQSTSLRAGMAAVAGSAEAIVFLLADTPMVDGPLVRALVGEHRRTLAPIVAPRAGGRWANPVLFDRLTFAALAQIEGDRGGRALFGRYPVRGVDWSDDILLDVDRPEDLVRLRRLE